MFGVSQPVDNLRFGVVRMSQVGAKDANSRYAVFSFLAGFWRKDYTVEMAKITQPTLVVFGEQASSISPSGMAQTPQQRCQAYEQGWQNAQSQVIVGRNVLPYESTAAFVQGVIPFWQALH